MKIFLDTPDPEAVARAHATGLLDGVTTNPSKVAEAGLPFKPQGRDHGNAVMHEVASTALDINLYSVNYA